MEVFGQQQQQRELSFSQRLKQQRVIKASDVPKKKTTPRVDDNDNDSSDERVNDNNNNDKKKKKRSKNAPQVLSTRVPVKRQRVVVPGPAPSMPRDPRFDGLSGEFSRGEFVRSYGFLDAQREQEIKALKQLLQSDAIEEEEKEDIEEQIRTLQRHESIARQHRDMYEVDTRVGTRVREMTGATAAEDGSVQKKSKEVHLKKKQIKEIRSEERLKMLQERGEAKKYTQKKKKKEQQKQKRMLPNAKRK